MVARLRTMANGPNLWQRTKIGIVCFLVEKSAGGEQFDDVLESVCLCN